MLVRSGPILRRERDSPSAPLSPQQEALWLEEQIDPGMLLHHVRVDMHILGPLDVDALRRSLLDLAVRHDILRIIVVREDDHVRQIACTAVDFDLPLIALHGASDERLRIECETIERERFDLQNGPLFRAVLVQRSDEHHLLVTVQHHLITDGWSLGLLGSELCERYRAQCSDAALPVLATSASPYLDASRRWRDQFGTPESERQRAYWKSRLSELPVLHFPFEGAVGDGTARVSVAYDNALTSELKRFARQEDATLFEVLLSAFAGLLSRYSEQIDFGVATVFANRNERRLHSVLGFFANTVIVRCELGEEPSCKEVLRRVSASVREAARNQLLPFAEVVRDGIASSPRRAGLPAQASFVFQNLPLPKAETGTTRWTTLLETPDGSVGGSRFDIALVLREENGELVGAITCRTSVMSEPALARMAGHLKMLFAGVVTAPDSTLGGLPVLTEQEHTELTVEWNRTETQYPRGKCVHTLFEEQVRRSPQAVAATSDEHSLSFDSLNRRSNALACQLRGLGVVPEVRVGVCFAPSVEAMIAILAVLKAGGAYVPLDPRDPSERLAAIARDAGLATVLCQPGDATRFSFIDHVVRVDVSAAMTSAESPRTDVTPDNLAYVMYTSGSSGTPKGVMVHHRGLVNYLWWASNYYGVANGRGALVPSRLGFDLSVTGLFCPLLVGRTVHLISEDPPIDGLVRRLRQLEDLSILKVTPSHLDVLRALVKPAEFAGKARVLIVGGEALSYEMLESFRSSASGMRIINEYGPTETIVGCCAFDVPIASDGRGPVPIGRPIANTRLYVLSPGMQHQPLGVPGELYVGGDGVARGYLGHPDATAAAFRTDPFSTEKGARMYRTGDLVQRLSDGNLAFLGRRDEQIKLRGRRIELGEVESVLRQHEHITACAVTVCRLDAGDGYLVAYVVRADASLSEDVVRSYARERLPDHLVPSAVVLLDALPFTSNGKVDRRALPLPPPPSRIAVAYEAPVGDLETTFCRIFGEELRIQGVGRHDDFVELGGNSLMAVRAVSRMREAGTEVEVGMLLEHRSAARLATAIAPKGGRRERPDSAPRTPYAEASERRPGLLEERLRDGQDGVEGVALATVSRSVLDAWTGRRAEGSSLEPLWCATLNTPLGRIGIVVLTVATEDVYAQKGKLLNSAVDACALARRMGARCVSLTGLLASALDYGHELARALPEGEPVPVITTGHATTAASVCLNVARMLELAQRDAATENLGVLGLGSIGRSALALWLRIAPHPRSIALCDVFSRLPALQVIERELRSRCGYQGEVTLHLAREKIPADFYGSSCIVAATNVPNVLSVDQLRSKTILIDDSAPSSFSHERARDRFRTRGDILFTDGGAVCGGAVIRRTVDPRIPRTASRQLEDGSHIMGCTLSALLSARFGHLPATLGSVQVDDAVAHYEALRGLGFEAAPPLCAEYAETTNWLERFRMATPTAG